MSEDYEFLKNKLKLKYPFSTYFYSGAVGSGLALYSKIPIEEVFYQRYSVGGRPEDIFKGDWFAGKGMGVAKLRTETGRAFTVINTHMAANYNRTIGGYDGYETHKIIQSFEFKKMMEDQAIMGDHVIGLGDFNIQPASLAYRAFLSSNESIISRNAKYPQMFESAFANHEPPSFNNQANTFRKHWEAEQAIDHIFHYGLVPSNSRMVMDGMVEHFNISLSDHFGIAVDYSFADESQVDFSSRKAGYDGDAIKIELIEKIRKHMKLLKGQRFEAYGFSAIFMIFSIGFLTWSLMTSIGYWPEVNWLKLAALFPLSVLFFVLAFAQLFKGFAFVGEEMAAHKQFLQSLLSH